MGNTFFLYQLDANTIVGIRGTELITIPNAHVTVILQGLRIIADAIKPEQNHCEIPFFQKSF